VMPSSEMVTRSRGCSALDRDGTSPERGCPAPERGGIPPEGGDRTSSEVEPHPRGRPTLERGGTSPEGVSGPRARWSYTGEAPCPSSESEFHPEVARPIVWWAVGPWGYLAHVLKLVCVCFLRM
jgi:hypothetical protein